MSDSPQVSVVNDTPSKQDAKGRFRRGNAGGPGNPFARQVAELRKAMLEAVTVERIRNITESMVQRAESGDVAAAKLVLQYTLGKPAAAVEPDRVEIDEHRLRAESALPAHVWTEIFDHLPAARVNELADTLGPLLEKRLLEPIVQTMNGEEPTRMSRTARKAMRREMRRLRREAAPSPNGGNGAGSKVRSDKLGLPLDRDFGPDRAG
jgi:hypothetical protein